MFSEVWELEKFQTAKVTLKVTEGHWCMCMFTERAMAHCGSSEVLIVGGVACKSDIQSHSPNSDRCISV